MVTVGWLMNLQYYQLALWISLVGIAWVYGVAGDYGAAWIAT